MIIEVDPGDPTPVYEQIRAQVVRMVVSGTLASGTRLPTIRQLASDLGLAKGTVAKAYETLLRDGTVVSAGRLGTLVAPTARPDDAARDDGVQRAARTFAVSLRQLGVDRATALAALDAALEELGEAPSDIEPEPGRSAKGLAARTPP